MRQLDPSTLCMGLGFFLLAVALVLGYVGSASYVTQIVATAPDKDAMANETRNYEPSEINLHLYSNLSEAEQTAFDHARQSPVDRYSDRGVSDSGSTFEYSNDVSRNYFVGYEGRIYLVRAVVDSDYRFLVLGVVSGIGGLLLLSFGAWRKYLSSTTESRRT